MHAYVFRAAPCLQAGTYRACSVEQPTEYAADNRQMGKPDGVFAHAPPLRSATTARTS